MNKGMVYSLEEVSKKILSPSEELTILNQVSFQVMPEDTLAVVGASGSGKTTLLQLMAGLDQPSQGKVNFQGQDLAGLSWEDRSGIRNKKIGYVFQFHHLLPEFSALENVAMPCILGGLGRKSALEKAGQVLETIQINHLAKRQVTALSGGERQLVAIARAIIQTPPVILADEPTGNLDKYNENMVCELLLRLNQEYRTTLVVVTHNHDLANKMKRKIYLHAGEVRGE